MAAYVKISCVKHLLPSQGAVHIMINVLKFCHLNQHCLSLKITCLKMEIISVSEEKGVRALNPNPHLSLSLNPPNVRLNCQRLSCTVGNIGTRL